MTPATPVQCTETCDLGTCVAVATVDLTPLGGSTFCKQHGDDWLARRGARLIEETYQRACAIPSDIHEHLPLLRWLAARCEHITEFGTRWANGSTIAFLAAQPETFITWDFDPYSIVSQRIADLLMIRGYTDFQPRVGNTLAIAPIEQTDLLFIDTLHTQKQLTAELERHADPIAATVKKYLVFHDTATFGMQGEDGSTPGLRAAIRHFQRNHAFPLWQLMRPTTGPCAGRLLDLENNNGLVVLEHVCAEGHSADRKNGSCVWCGQRPTLQ